MNDVGGRIQKVLGVMFLATPKEPIYNEREKKVKQKERQKQELKTKHYAAAPRPDYGFIPHPS